MAEPLRGGLWPAAGGPAGPLPVDGWPPGQGIYAPDPGGASLRQIAQMGQSLGSFAIGVSLQRAASLLSQRSRGEVIALPHLMTLDHCDTFIHQLAKLSGRRVPARLSASAASCRMR